MAKLNIKKLAMKAAVRGGGALVGGAAGQAVNSIIPASIDPLWRGIGKAVIGAVIPEVAPKVEFLDYAGAGMVGQAGGELLAVAVPALATPAATTPGTSGIGAEEDFPMEEDKMSGSDTPVSGAEENTSPVSGMDDPAGVEME